MAERFHIGKDGQPHKCTAAAGKCPLGGEHYGNMKDALQAAENQSMKKYAAATRSLAATNRVLEQNPDALNDSDRAAGTMRQTKGFQDKTGKLVTKKFAFREEQNKDPETGRFIAGKHWEHSEKYFPTYKTRQSAAERKAFDIINSDADKAIAAADAERDPLRKLAMLYASRDAAQADFEAIKEDFRNSDNFADIVFETADGATYIESYGEVDQDYLRSQGVDPEQFYKNGPETLNTKKIRDEYIAQAIDKELGLNRSDYADPKEYQAAQRAAMKERGWKAADRNEFGRQAAEKSGMFETTTTYKPDAATYTAFAAGKPVYERHYEAGSSKSAAAFRNSMTAYGKQYAKFNDAVAEQEALLRKEGQVHHNDEGYYFRTGSDDLKFKSRSVNGLADSRRAKDKTREFIKSTGKDRSEFTASRKSSRVTLDDWKSYAKEHNLNYWAGVAPKRRVSFVDKAVYEQGKLDTPQVSMPFKETK